MFGSINATTTLAKSIVAGCNLNLKTKFFNSGIIKRFSMLGVSNVNKSTSSLSKTLAPEIGDTVLGNDISDVGS